MTDCIPERRAATRAAGASSPPEYGLTIRSAQACNQSAEESTACVQKTVESPPHIRKRPVPRRRTIVIWLRGMEYETYRPGEALRVMDGSPWPLREWMQYRG